MIIDVDVLVLGTGIAGLSFALHASRCGRVALVTKKRDTESNTNYAQGGVAAVMDPDDSFEAHIRDTLTTGVGLCHEDAVEILVREGPDRVRELIELGVRFTRNNKAKNPLRLHLGREGGHSARRIVHAADLTGREIERALVAQVKANHDIRLFEHDHAIDLIVDRTNDRTVCRGAYVLDSETGDVTAFRAKVTMLATGGLGQVYLHTTNPEIATGDGVAMAYRAGAVIANMEFIQFHPTTLYHPGARSFLISEAVRGEGGILRLANGETFMEKYHEMGNLAPRDVVARAIDAELKKSGDECVYLDVTHLPPEFVREHFPHIYETCLSVGIDITKEWIPIVPAAHYACGGVLTDTNGRTTIENLYACGEVACTGVHGANRLASNSLLEAIVFARRAALDTQSRIDTISFGEVEEFPLEKHSHPVPEDQLDELILELRTAMWKYVGIVRTDERLKKALHVIRNIGNRAEQLYESGRLSPKLLELRNMAQTAELIVRSALWRKESRGLHYNLDYPYTDDVNFKRDTLLVRNGDEPEQLLSLATRPGTIGGYSQ
ncbi:MAG: L-aspartate oxidase [Armatimonadota bacterium]|nr:L-aspartate oxidase [Armatimonadota bacterium]